MCVFDAMVDDGYEQVVFGHDRDTGLRAVIAIHDTTLGPSLGGVRMQPYETEEEAVADALRLARAMTFKFAAAGIEMGGGKSVIIGDPETEKTEALLRSFGRLVATLGGRYIPGVDMGTTQDDMRTIGLEADPVSCTGADPSPFTAIGVYAAIRACVGHLDGCDDLRGVRVAIQGVGHVGAALARMLAEDGADLVIADIDRERVLALAEELDAEVVGPDEIVSVPCDVLAPCAGGSVINDAVLPSLKTRVVAGGANNILAEPRHAEALREAGVLYAPDYIANAGGVTLIDAEQAGQTLEEARERCLALGDRIAEVLRLADKSGITTVEAADELAEARLAAARERRASERRGVSVGAG
jgi:glutamate dehydrogenase/leucine dehydrogenase